MIILAGPEPGFNRYRDMRTASAIITGGSSNENFTGEMTSRAGRAHCAHDREVPEVDLFTPISIRGVTFRNRIAMSPMCMYSANDGYANDFHLVHLGSRAVGGVGLVVVEATSITADGRITPKDVGIWTDDHIEPLARIAGFLQAHGAVAGIQLAHAGRKASCAVPWEGGARLKTAAEGGWPVVGPSPLPFDNGDPVPKELDEHSIEHYVEAWATAARRALAAGFK